jgi:hypothetical protein
MLTLHARGGITARIRHTMIFQTNRGLTRNSIQITPLYRDHPSFRLAGLRRFHTFAEAPRDIPKQWAEFNQLAIPRSQLALYPFLLNLQFQSLCHDI